MRDVDVVALGSPLAAGSLLVLAVRGYGLGSFVPPLRFAVLVLSALALSITDHIPLIVSAAAGVVTATAGLIAVAARGEHWAAGRARADRWRRFEKEFWAHVARQERRRGRFDSPA